MAARSRATRTTPGRRTSSGGDSGVREAINNVVRALPLGALAKPLSSVEAAVGRLEREARRALGTVGRGASRAAGVGGGGAAGTAKRGGAKPATTARRGRTAAAAGTTAPGRGRRAAATAARGSTPADGRRRRGSGGAADGAAAPASRGRGRGRGASAGASETTPQRTGGARRGGRVAAASRSRAGTQQSVPAPGDAGSARAAAEPVSDSTMQRDALLAELRDIDTPLEAGGALLPEDDVLASEELSAITGAPQAPGPLP